MRIIVAYAYDIGVAIERNNTMERTKIEWKKPVMKSTTFEDIAKHIRAMARSGGTSCNICSTSCSPPSCSGCGGCSCSGSCDPIMFYFSCEGHFFVGWGKK